MKNKIYWLSSIILSLLIILLGFKFNYSFIRFWECIKELINSFGYFLNELFDTNFKIDSELVLKINHDYDLFLPIDFKTFEDLFTDYFCYLFNFETLKIFWNNLGIFLEKLIKVILLMLPLVILLSILFDILYFKTVTDVPNKDSKPLILFKKYFLNYISKIKKEFVLYFNFLKKKKIFLYLWFIVFSFYFNFINIIIFFLAFYFYFVTSMNFINLYILIYKIIFDLLPLYNFLPKIFWVILSLIIFNFLRKKWALARLKHFENRNKGFVNSLGQVSLTVGPPGTSKTLTITDMILSQEIMYRDKALEKLMYYDKMFPDFPFINLEREVEEAFNNHVIFNLASCKKWIKEKISKSFCLHNENGCFSVICDNPKNFFDYDYSNKKKKYFNGYKEIDIFDMVTFYSQCYFIYIIRSSLIESNYAIRSDNKFDSVGNFPFWHQGFFNVNPDYVAQNSIFSHIMDFDAYRMYKTVITDSKASFDIGVKGKSEIAKERGNQLDHRGFKKDSEEANQLNDGYNDSWKMGRHAGTVDNTSFFKILADDQRADSLGSDARELTEKIVYIANKSDVKNTVLFFKIEFWLYGIIKNKYENLYKKYRYYRCDNTLLFFLIKHIFNIYHRYIDRLYNRFGYFISTLETEAGTRDSAVNSDKYYLMFSKIYLNRYSTDCFSDFFDVKNLRSNKGLNDIPTYSNERANIEELKKQNSYFIDKMVKNNL